MVTINKNLKTELKMLLRWKLVYQSGIVRVGHWSRDVDRDQAWLKSKEGLAHAFI